VFGYCPTPRVGSWKPFTLAQDMLADWVTNDLESLASKAPFGDGLVQLGLAFDGFFLPKEVVVALFQKVKALGIKLITSHYGRGVITGTSFALHKWQKLMSCEVIVHFRNF
jgi:hypothetical protein